MAINIISHNYSVVRNTSPGREVPKYIVLHYTATNGATAANEVMYFATNPAAVNASADFFVDDNEIRQYNTSLESRYSWAVGDGSGGTYGGKCNNANQISIEMCCYISGGKWYIGDKTYKNAVELTKYLMKKYDIPAANVIRHYDVSCKLCPNAVGWLHSTGSEETWRRFRQDISGNTATTTTAKTDKPVSTPIYRVRRSAADAKTQIGAYAVLTNAKKQADAHPGYGVYDMSGKLVYAPSAKTKSTDEIAREVIAGKWGNGSDRKNRLTAAGYDYAAVQTAVNKLLR